MDDLAAWAWARHHNVWSWYVRPLLLIPFCLFAYRRSGVGMAASIIALFTSMAWFPVPDVIDPEVEAFLAMEREYLLGEWTAWKVALSLTVPLFFAALGAAFWRRSLAWGLVVINGAALGKIAWSLAYGQDSGGAVVVPAVVGMIVVSAGAVYWLRKRPPSPPSPRGERPVS